jgi:hypothetical protein
LGALRPCLVRAVIHHDVDTAGVRCAVGSVARCCAVPGERNAPKALMA